jgi:hypothetical protein
LRCCALYHYRHGQLRAIIPPRKEPLVAALFPHFVELARGTAGRHTSVLPDFWHLLETWQLTGWPAASV